MNALLWLVLVVAQAPRVESKFEQVLPKPPREKGITRSEGQTRAVVLLHGLHMLPLNSDRVVKPHFRDWQGADAKMVHEVGKHADVFAFAYAQDVPVDDVAPRSGLPDNIAALRKLGYRDIVLIGHSAGGLVAREFVEDNPKAGVTRVIQVCSPNGGSNWAGIPGAARKKQAPFVRSLTKEARHKALEARQGKKIPAEVAFVCVVGTSTRSGDGFVARDCAWTEHLQGQGIPALALEVTHRMAVRDPKAVEVIAKLVTQELPRWDEKKVAQARKDILAVKPPPEKASGQ